MTLGLPALYKDDDSGDGPVHGFDLLALVNGTTQLLELYQGVTAKLNDMEVEELRRVGELDSLRARHSKLKVRAAPGSFPHIASSTVLIRVNARLSGD